MGVGVPSQGEFADRPIDRVSPSGSGTEWTIVVDSWESASSVARFGCLLGFALALSASMIGAIPAASGLTIAVLIPAALVDLRHHRLPDPWLGVGAVVLLVGVGLSWSVGSTVPALSAMAAGATLMTTMILLLHLVSPSSMGFGDVKLAVILGAAIGVIDWNLAIPALALAAGSTATVGLVARARFVAFGPGLVGGALAAMLAHDLLVRT